jgi:RNA polymerase sigma-70 factor, ECF subfamily
MTNEEYAAAYAKGFNLTLRLALSRGLSADDAREAAQAAWAKGWERRAQLRKPSMVVTWVNTIALNWYRSSLRGKPRFEELQEHPNSTEQNVAAIDVKALLNNCRPSDRLVLEEHYLLGMKVSEIAGRHGWTETAVRIRLLRARRNLREKLEKKSVPPCYFQPEYREAEVANSAPAAGAAKLEAHTPAKANVSTLKLAGKTRRSTRPSEAPVATAA